MFFFDVSCEGANDEYFALVLDITDNKQVMHVAWSYYDYDTQRTKPMHVDEFLAYWDTLGYVTHMKK